MTRDTCDRCKLSLSAEAIALGWPVAVQPDKYICPDCYGAEAYCPAGHVLRADEDATDCPRCPGEPAPGEQPPGAGAGGKTRAQYREHAPNEVAFIAPAAYGSEEVVYWAPATGGYVRVVSDERPGTLGRQIHDATGSGGAMLEWHPSSGPLIALMRKQRRARARQIERGREA